MLLDRKRINKWAKIMSAILVVVFGLSFVALGVGSGTGLNWSELWNSTGGGDSTGAGSLDDQVAAYQATLQSDPNNAEALLGLANAYKALQQPFDEATALEKLAQLKPDDSAVQIRLAAIYMAPDSQDYGAAVRVLNKVTTLEPANASAFLQLGAAERGAGNAAAAIMAWNRYLQLEPQGDMAETVKQQLALLVQSTETTATAGSTVTTVAPTTTTAP